MHKIRKVCFQFSLFVRGLLSEKNILFSFAESYSRSRSLDQNIPSLPEYSIVITGIHASLPECFAVITWIFGHYRNIIPVNVVITGTSCHHYRNNRYFYTRCITLFGKSMFWKKSCQFLIFMSHGMQNFAVGWPTILKLSPKEKFCLHSRRPNYSGN